MVRQVYRFAAVMFALALSGLTACGSVDVKNEYPRPVGGSERYDSTTAGAKDPPGLFSGLEIFGGGSNEGAGIGVNSFLWRASLDTLSFMPLESADPFGGVIITDWFQPPEAPNEQVKVTVYILDKALRADALRVSVFRQEKTAEGWKNAAVDPKTITQLENAILTRARQLRVAAVN
ncbi:MAG: DUF3576 domain-containing protein [Alphaproteobacteria bacterium]|nr:DUF3576 domain-containing protein [Alphaproteobacteria bacterium]